MNDKEYLDPVEAVRLMLNGETLINNENNECRWDTNGFDVFNDKSENWDPLLYFDNLTRKTKNKKRLMTREECLGWARSSKAVGWVVGIDPVGPNTDWDNPLNLFFDKDIECYRRAIFAKGDVDISTITDFTIKE
jgi:hypothetical protein